MITHQFGYVTTSYCDSFSFIHLTLVSMVADEVFEINFEFRKSMQLMKWAIKFESVAKQFD